MDNKMEKSDFLKKMKVARENVNKFATLPYGAYYTKLEKAFYKPSSKDKPMVTFVYKVLDGEQRTKEHRVFYHVWNDTAFNILIQDLENLGFPTDQIASMDQLIEVLNSIESQNLNVDIRIYENPKNIQYPQTRIEQIYENESDVAKVNEAPPVVKDPVSDVTETSAAEPDAQEIAEELVVENESDPETKPEPEEEVVEDETEQTIEIDVGSKVKFLWKEKEMVGIIKSTSQDGLSAKISSGGKVYPIKSENILAPA